MSNKFIFIDRIQNCSSTVAIRLDDILFAENEYKTKKSGKRKFKRCAIHLKNKSVVYTENEYFIETLLAEKEETVKEEK